MKQEQLNEIKARCESATPGPWKVGVYDGVHTDTFSPYLICCACAGRDMIFIAHARQDIPALIAEVQTQTQRANDWVKIARDILVDLDRLEAERDELKDELKETYKEINSLRKELSKNFYENEMIRTIAELKKVTAERDEWKHKAETLERATKGDCTVCVHHLLPSNSPTCNKCCRSESQWNFDYDGFKKKGVQNNDTGTA